MISAIHNVSPKLRRFIAAAGGTSRADAEVSRAEFNEVASKVDALLAEIDELFSSDKLAAAVQNAMGREAPKEESKVVNRYKLPEEEDDTPAPIIRDRFKLPEGD